MFNLIAGARGMAYALRGKIQFRSSRFCEVTGPMKQFAILLQLFLCCSIALPLLGQPHPEIITVDAAAPATPFPHFWEEMFGSGRAILSLRSSYRSDLRAVKKVTDFQYVRFHGILLDEVGVYSKDRQGNPRYNFTYVDQIYDGLLENGVRPFVEISFMPKALAARLDYQGFWYKPIVSPPKDYAQWDDLITRFTQHLIDRYGRAEVEKWYFEVWNEPNLNFWSGKPAQESYFELYSHTARSIQSVDPHLRVGGPATAQAAWIQTFIAYTVKNHVPVDFISSHIYGMDKASKVFGPGVSIPPSEMVYRGIKKMHDDIAQSARPKLPLIVSEFSADAVRTGKRNTVFMGPWLANLIRQSDGLAAMISFWPFSDVFEEQGVPDAPFSTHSAREGRGLIAPDGIPKPSYVAFQLLHHLGDQRITTASKDAILTKSGQGKLVIALWNLPGQSETPAVKEIRLNFRHISRHSGAVVYRLDKSHEDTLGAYRAMGSPVYPTHAQVEKLWQVAAVHPAEKTNLRKNTLTLSLPPDGLAIVEVNPLP